jgi:hypothetical protein
LTPAVLTPGTPRGQDSLGLGTSLSPPEAGGEGCVIEVLCDAADGADCDRHKLLNIARGCIIIHLPDGASLCSPREDARGHPVAAFNHRNRSPQLLSLVWVQGLIVIAGRSVGGASAW